MEARILFKCIPKNDHRYNIETVAAFIPMILTPRRQLSRMIPVIGVAALILVAWAPGLAAAQNEITFSLNRDFGTGLGNNIQGTFTLHGSAPASVVNLTVYFNSTEVHFVTGNTIDWQFNTDNYSLGPVNITLVGIDNQGTIYKVSHDFVFITGGPGNLIMIGAIALAVVLVIAKYGWRFRSKKSKPAN